MEWYGVVKSGVYDGAEQSLRKELARAIEAGEWPGLFAILEKRPELVNAVCLDDPDWQAPVHRMVLQEAPVEAIERSVNLGAWRTLKTRGGERAMDMAARLGRPRLAELLNPVYHRIVDLGLLAQIQAHFHRVILGRIEVLPDWQSLRLPELEVLLEIEEPIMWFPVPGMYGGFRYRLEIDGGTPKLVSDSWCRVVGGSEERHEVTPEGVTLIERELDEPVIVIKRGPRAARE